MGKGFYFMLYVFPSWDIPHNHSDQIAMLTKAEHMTVYSGSV